MSGSPCRIGPLTHSATLRCRCPISVLDAQIAAITMAHEATLLTRNTTDFRGVGLIVHDPWRSLPPRPRR